MTGFSPQEVPSPDGSRPTPEAAAPRPEGLVMEIEGPLRRIWLAPEAIRPLPPFGAWHRDMMGKSPEDCQYAALDVIVILMDAGTGIKPGTPFHLKIPGDPTTYRRFLIESKDSDKSAGAVPKRENEFVCLLLRLTTNTAHPVALQASEVSVDERCKGKFL